MAKDNRDLVHKVDGALHGAFPGGWVVLQVIQLPADLSEWCETTRYDIRLRDGSTKKFFEKRATGQRGYGLAQCHWESETSLYRFIPEFIPRPVASGTYRSQPDMHFILLEYVDMVGDVLPAPADYVAPVAALHLRSMGKSPNGMFGFPVKTFFGTLPYSNDWETSWETWWTKHMRFVVEREERLRGPATTDESQLIEAFFAVVLPRYLRPLETKGRTVKPTLCHADLWPGNVKYRKGTKTPIIYDASALWCHHEVELAPLRNPRYELGHQYIEEYWKHVARSEPEEDADSRIDMYLVRNQIQLAALYPTADGLRDSYLSSMQLLVTKVLEERKSQ